MYPIQSKDVDTILLNTLKSLVKKSPTGVEIVSDNQLLDLHERIIRYDHSSIWKELYTNQKSNRFFLSIIEDPNHRQTSKKRYHN
jgi:hypothetical protein